MTATTKCKLVDSLDWIGAMQTSGRKQDRSTVLEIVEIKLICK